MDTETPTTDLVIIDAEIVEDDASVGQEIAKTVATTAATSAVILVGIYAYNRLKPKVASMLARAKETEKPAEESQSAETPETQKV